MIDNDFVKFFNETVYKKYYGKNSVRILPRPGTSNYVHDATSDFNEYNAYFICKKCGFEHREEYEIYKHMKKHFDEDMYYYAIVHDNPEALGPSSIIHYRKNIDEVEKCIRIRNISKYKVYKSPKMILQTDFNNFIQIKNHIELIEENK